MCIHMEPIVFIIYVFTNLFLNKQKSINLKDLRKIRDYVTEEMPKNQQAIFVHWTRTDVLGSLQQFQDLFKKEKDYIILQQDDIALIQRSLSIEYTTEFNKSLNMCIKDWLITNQYVIDV